MLADIYDPAFWEEQWRNIEDGDTKIISKGYGAPEYWDNIADKYDKSFNKATQERLDRLADHLERTGYLWDGAEVLDIGCGTGRLAITLASRGARVTCIDISAGMLAKLKENCPNGLPGSIIIQHVDWHTVNLARRGWENSFDLVVANMNPALNTYDSLYRMIKASRHGCFLKTWAEKYSAPVFRSIWRSIAGRELRDRHAPIVYIFNLLLARGFHPSLNFEEVQFSQPTTVEDAIKSNTAYFLKIFGESNTLIPDIVAEEVERLSSNGMVTESVHGMSATLLWTI